MKLQVPIQLMVNYRRSSLESRAIRIAMNIKKITVTGTKGKTTVVNFLAQILLYSKKFESVLHVNTTGHFVNGKRKSTLQDSSDVWGVVPSVSPGRYLYELLKSKDNQQHRIAVLEASLGSSSSPGLGYAWHDVGIFLNVFEDHIGSSDRIKDKRDILKAKSFIVKRILRDGYAVLNYDDELVMEAYDMIDKDKQINTIFFGRGAVPEKIAGAYITILDGWVVYKSAKSSTFRKIIKCVDISWTMQGTFVPSLYNLMAVIAGVTAINRGVIPGYLKEALQITKFPEDSGRLSLFKNKDNVTIIADYAHEKVSLSEIATLARQLTHDHGRVIGVVRLAYDRTYELIADTAKHIAPVYDEFIVYDKIDGFWKKAKPIQGKKFIQENGKISKIFSDELLKYNTLVTRIVREDEAIEAASRLAKKGDVVIVIVNDDIKRSVSFIKKSFNAKFIS
jgi:UDP-N-acetylmuramyl tripeptide synthase